MYVPIELLARCSGAASRGRSVADDGTGRAWWPGPPPGAEPPPPPSPWGPATTPLTTGWTPGTGPPWPTPRQEGLAGAALVRALAALVPPVVPAIVALVLAARAAARIRASGGALTGMGLVVAARVV